MNYPSSKQDQSLPLLENSEIEKCPICQGQWRGENIYEHFLKAGKTEVEATEFADMYGATPENPKYFSNLIGIEVWGVYDGVLYHECPHCHQRFRRNFGE